MPNTSKNQIVINKLTITFSNGTTKEMEETDQDGEFYAESQDVGIFYFPATGRVWAQGLAPTYQWEVLTNDFDITILE